MCSLPLIFLFDCQTYLTKTADALGNQIETLNGLFQKSEAPP